MSCICVIPVVVAGGAVAWPAVAAAAVATAALMGFKSVRSLSEAETSAEIELPSTGTEAVSKDLGRGQGLVFQRGDVQVEFLRNTRGAVAVKVHGRNKTEAELKALGEKIVNTLTQQYAYHRLVTELKQRDFTIVEEEIEQDGNVRLRVRVFQG